MPPLAGSPPTQVPEGGMTRPLLQGKAVLPSRVLYKPPSAAHMAPQAEAKIILRPVRRPHTHIVIILYACACTDRSRSPSDSPRPPHPRLGIPLLVGWLSTAVGNMRRGARVASSPRRCITAHPWPHASTSTSAPAGQGAARARPRGDTAPAFIAGPLLRKGGGKCRTKHARPRGQVAPGCLAVSRSLAPG